MKVLIFFPLFFLIFVPSLFAVDTNIALSGTATQSSTYHSGGAASNAIDNDTNGAWGGNSVTHTAPATSYDWWQLDLGSIQYISKVDLFNRTDCCGDRLEGVYIMISDTPFTNGTDSTALDNARSLSDWQDQIGNNPGSTVAFTTGGVLGRYILIQKDNDSDALSLAEVQVWSPAVTPPIAEYRFDECSYDGSNDEVLDTIGSIHGKTKNGATLSSEAKLCSSASFDGIDDKIRMGKVHDNTFGTSNDTFTVSAWIKPNIDDKSTSILITKNNFKLQIKANNKLKASIKAGSNTSISSTAATLRDGAWHFVAVSYDGSASPSLKIYVDGNEYQDNVNNTGNLIDATDKNFDIGASSYNGLIDEVKIFDVALPSIAINTIYSNENTSKNYEGNTRVCNSCAPSYCQENSLTEGFHIVDPDGDDDSNSYEIYCDMTSAKAPRELIALPLKNNYNNFVFEDDSPSNNYYSEADSAITAEPANSFDFLEVVINATDIYIKPSSIAEGSSNAGYFSNINLIGTPFTIDWDNTTLSNCDEDKLRIGADNQAVKINTLDYTNGRCRVHNMRLKLLDEYAYLTFHDIQGTHGTYGEEILEETCRQIFEKVPDDATHLPTLSGASNGYFWIDPDQDGRGTVDTVSTKFRPIVAYCKYQEDIEQAWTFVMALDGKVTNSRNDVKTMDEVRANPIINHDTCSQLGLLFFVPNTKDTFQRTKNYLTSNKSEWIDYTGTVREKFQMYGLATEYYKQGEGYNEIWPYGPFGVYHPYGGNKDKSGNNLTWGASSNTMGQVSGRCMNSGVDSGATECTDFTQIIFTDDDGSLGMAGWRTTLMDQVAAGLSGIVDGDQWWVADVGAGNYIHNNVANSGTPECSITSPGSNRATSGACDEEYYEPNGNYTQDAWLNFIADSNGNVYHNDDWDNNYPYYDYMCMSWDNYARANRYVLNEGPFTVIERPSPPIDTSSGYPIFTPSDLNITTKILQEPKNYDALLLSDNRAEIIDDQNISAGLFLVSITQKTVGATTANQFTDLHYYGEFGSTNDFNLASDPRGVIALDNALSTITNANKRLSFQFKYCGYSDTWTDCWTTSRSGTNTTASCVTGYDNFGNPNSPCQVADSNDFALRPDSFSLSSVDGKPYGTTIIVKAKDINISYLANDFQGDPSYDYNVSFSTLHTGVKLKQTGLTCSTAELEDTNQSLYAFSDGIDSHTYTLTDVGVYTFDINETIGSEYAIIDKDDTPWTDRQISPNAITLTIKPNHFRLSSIPNPNFNTDGNFTYISNSLDKMSAKLDFNITAENSNNGRTLNYTDDCYAADFNLDANFTIPTNDSATANTFANVTTINYLIKDENNNDVAITNNNSPRSDLSFIRSTDTISKVLFTDDINGTAKIILKFNFNRTNNNTLNPFTINLNNLNISDQSTIVDINTTNQIIDHNATFVYGRAAGPKRAASTNCVDNQSNCTSGNQSPRIVFQIYKDSSGNDVTALNGATHDGTQDSRWWTSPFHDFNNILTDGNISIPTTSVTEITGTNVSQSNVVEESNFRYKVELHYNGGDNYVKEAHLKHTPSPWLIYDPTNAGASFNTFEHNFITEGWSGKNESKATSTTKAAHRTSKRILW